MYYHRFVRRKWSIGKWHCHCGSPFGLLASALIYTRKDKHIKIHYKWININKLLIARAAQNDTQTHSHTHQEGTGERECRRTTKLCVGEINLDWHKMLNNTKPNGVQKEHSKTVNLSCDQCCYFLSFVSRSLLNPLKFVFLYSLMRLIALSTIEWKWVIKLLWRES